MICRQPDRDSAPSALPIATWGLCLALLALEYLVALFFFDSERMPVEGWRETFSLIGQSMPLIIVVMTAALALGEAPSTDVQREIANAFRAPRRVWPLFVGHFLAYAIALSITIFVFNTALDTEQPRLWVALWLASAIGALLLLLAAIVPPAAVRPMGRPLARALVSGLVVGVLALVAGAATSAMWRPMSRLTLDIVVFLLDATGHEVVSIPEELVVGTPYYEIFVDAPCSGYEGIGLITVVLGFYLFFSRKSLRFPNALLLLPIGVTLIWLSNSMRIAALILVGTWVSPEIAEGGFHSAAGWLLFCLITLALVYVSRQSGWFALDVGRSAGSFRTPEGAYLLPLLFLIGTALVTGLVSTGFDYLYPLRAITPLLPLWLFRSYYLDFRWSWSWTPVLLGIAVFVLWVGLEPPANSETVAVIPDALVAMPASAAALWLIFRIIGSVVIVPIAEELAFRGYLLRRLVNADFTKVSPNHFTTMSFVISSLAFGLLHGRWLAGILAGMVYALAQYRRGRISDAIVAHAVTNALLAIYVLAFGQWGLW